MKKIIVILAIAFIYSEINAQDNKLSYFNLIGGFGGVSINMLSLKKSPSVQIGGQGAALFSNNIFIGGFGTETSSLSSVYSENNNYKNYQLETEYGGVI
jgi:hypothetical protein